MNIDLLKTLANYGFMVVGFVFPVALFYILNRRLGGKRPVLCVALCVFVTWVLLNIYDSNTRIIDIAYFQAHTDPNSELYDMYDGTGEGAAVLAIGWIFPLISLLGFLGVTSLLRFVRRRYFRLNRVG